MDIGYDPMTIMADYEISEDYIPKEGDIWIDGIKSGFYRRPELGLSYRMQKCRSINFGVGFCRQRGDFILQTRTRGDAIGSEIGILYMN